MDPYPSGFRDPHPSASPNKLQFAAIAKCEKIWNRKFKVLIICGYLYLEAKIKNISTSRILEALSSPGEMLKQKKRFNLDV